jgi:hypothetical protein
LRGATPGSKGATLEDLWTSQRVFARSPAVASLYGTTPWSGTGEPPTLADPARVGLLTRVGLLASGSSNTRPIVKGVFYRKGLLCDSIGAPPNNAAATPPALSPQLTTREVVEQLTQQPGSACASCHATLINPLGFSTEGFDALGRRREKQRLFDDTGKLLAEKAVDTKTTPGVFPGDPRPSTGPGDVTTLMLESGKPQACFARQYFRFTFARTETLASDGCVLAELQSALTEKQSLSSVVVRIAKTKAFRQRSF